MRVAALYRYPVKGLSPEPLEHVSLKPEEFFPGDRLYAIENGPSGFDPAAPVHQPKIKFLMLARNARLAALTTRYNDATQTLTIEHDERVVLSAEVTTEAGRAAIARFVQGLCEDEMRGPARLLSATKGFRFTDSRSGFVSLINLASVRAIAQSVGRSLDPLRFRANMYVSGLQAWEEFSLVGKTLRAGSLVLEPIKVIDRCFAIDVAPGAGTRDTNLLPLMERAFGHHDCGVYARIIAGGEMGIGDELQTEA
jgi:uncharacterized protein YcbX